MEEEFARVRFLRTANTLALDVEIQKQQRNYRNYPQCFELIAKLLMNICDRIIFPANKKINVKIRLYDAIKVNLLLIQGRTTHRVKPCYQATRSCIL